MSTKKIGREENWLGLTRNCLLEILGHPYRLTSKNLPGHQIFPQEVSTGPTFWGALSKAVRQTLGSSNPKVDTSSSPKSSRPSNLG